MNRLIYSVGGLILLAAAVLWFSTSVDVVESASTVGASDEARSDPWLAFAEGLSEDWTVERYEAADEIDLQEASFVALSWYDLEDQDGSQWNSWVEAGGHLILEFEGSDTIPSDWYDLPSFSGLLPMPVTKPQGDGKQALASIAQHPEFLPITGDPKVYFPSVRPDSATTIYRIAGSPAVIVRNVGQGWILATGEPIALSNKGLTEPGNRQFASALLADLDPGSGILWLPLAPDGEPVSKQADPKLGTVGLGLSLLLLALLIYWRAGPRLGPVLEVGERDRLSLRERFLAEGRFLWKHRVGSRLLSELPDRTPKSIPPRPTGSFFIREVKLWVHRKDRKTKEES